MNDAAEREFEVKIRPTILEGEIVETAIKDKFIQVTSELLSNINHITTVAAQSFYESYIGMKSHSYCPDKGTVTFGIEVDVKGNAFIAEASANSSIVISLEWHFLRGRNDG